MDTAAAAVATAAQAPAKRRVVLTKADRKLVDRAVKALEPAALAFVLCCRRCNQPMVRADDGGGFSCQCSTVVFV